eukprot:c11324_g1_i1 orf=385-1989(+)
MSPHLPPSLLQMLRPTSPECSDKSTGDRHFVTWTDQEDEILRQAVTTYGVDKWSVIAAQFCNKTSRQCRRRWHTYLVTDCKKGGWSPEEDQLLLEAHRRFGNRWTEIAKVVPGRTDNAVKNRFSALGKKQAKKSNAFNGGEDLKTVPKRKVLEQNSSSNIKRNRGDYSQFSHCNYTLQQRKQHHIQVKQSLQTWATDQSMADRAHPVHNEKIRKDVPFSNMDRTLQDSRAFQNKRVPNTADVLTINKSTSKEVLGIGTLQTSRSFSENVSPPRLAALTQNAALLDSLVERRDARLKLWRSIDDAWKPFDWFTMEDSSKILQPANFTCKNEPLGDLRTLYEGKENYIGFSQISCESQNVSIALPISQEPVSQQKHLHELGIATPTIQHERAWKVRSNLDGLDCSSPSDEISYHADDSTPLQTDHFSSFPVDQPICSDHNEVEPRITCDVQCEGSRDGLREAGESAAMMNAAMDYNPSSIDFTWDSQFFMDDMPSPQFSDSEKQFLLSALDSSYQPSMLEAYGLGSNFSMTSFCTS